MLSKIVCLCIQPIIYFILPSFYCDFNIFIYIAVLFYLFYSVPYRSTINFSVALSSQQSYIYICWLCALPSIPHSHYLSLFHLLCKYFTYYLFFILLPFPLNTPDLETPVIFSSPMSSRKKIYDDRERYSVLRLLSETVDQEELTPTSRPLLLQLRMCLR